MCKKLQLFALAAVMIIGRISAAAEICGNGVDDDSDGYADEGCFSNWVMGQCPSAISCETTGDIAPVTGAFVYQLPPDLAPTVPYGAKLEFRRIYMSKYSPTATNYRTAMGPRWQHNWMSWLDKSGTSAVVHLPTGQEVKFTYSGTIGGFDYYTPQAGYHVKHLRQATTGPNNWELRTLTGETYVYNWSSPVGKLIEVRDSLATPNKIVIAYFTNGGNNGQIDTITEASGKKRFKFSYSQGRVSSVAYQTVSGGTGTTRVTLSFSYTSTNPTTVQIDSNTVQTNTYTSNYLTAITDGASKKLIEVSYSSATPGKVVNVTTGDGGIGYEYASSNSQCTSGTVLYFNLANTAACSNDASCGSGYRCGGKTGAGGSDGKCYRAARCLQTASPSEDLVTTVTAFTPCTGACAPTAQYSWNTTTLDLKGIKLADNNWTSFSRNSDGLATVIAEGDSDDNPTNSGGAKTWLFYGDANFPGRITERRTKSSIRTEGTFACDGSNAAGCKRTQYTWNSDGLLGSLEEDGFQIDASNAVASFAYTTSFTYDTKGRLTEIDGPLSGANDVTQYTYWTSSDVFKDGYAKEVKRKKDSTNFLITTLDDYDYFGNAKSTEDPDSSFTCRTWDASRNYLTQVREAMNGQVSCTTSDSSDLTTTYVRDSSLRLTKTTRPLGDCEHREYDAYGRLEYTKLRDDCVAGNPGNTQRQYYTANGFNEKTEYLDASSTVTRRILRADSDSMQMSALQNPVSPSYSRSFAYFADGQLQSVTGENGLDKTENVRDAQNRETIRKKFLNSILYQSWTIDYPTWSTGDPTDRRQKRGVTDPASKGVTTDYDDLGRKNRIISPDSGTTIYVHDAASRLSSMVEAYGAGNYTHSFTYDSLGRKLSEDYDDGLEDCSDSISPVTDVTYEYDDVTCPGGASCTGQTGRLAHVKSRLLCDSSLGDYSLDQDTFYSYDDAGRLVQEYIQDDSGRTAIQSYTWDKNGNLTELTTPSGAAMTYTLGGTGNSDANSISTLARTVSGSPTNLLTSLQWEPFGPVTQYDQANTISGNTIRATLSYNLAYRATQIKYATSSTNTTTIDYTEDEKGRYTQKLYSNVNPVVQDSYMSYDWLDRLTCDNTSSGSCPTSGTAVRSNITYNSSNDRGSFYHYHPSYAASALQYTINYTSGSDKISSVVDSTGSTSYYGYDARGSRTYEDNTGSSYDRRDYTYDQRRRVRTVTGKYLRTKLVHTWNDYRITYAYDQRDRLVYRSFQDLTLGGGGTSTFYYYDINDRLIEVKFTPNVTSPSTYDLYDFYWIGSKPVAQWETDFPAATTTRSFMHSDDSNRVIEMYDWPSSGDATLRWALDPDGYGWERGTGGFQPLRLNGAIIDTDTFARRSDPTFIRPPLLIMQGKQYDPMLDVFLQRTGTWPSEPFSNERHNPGLQHCTPAGVGTLVSSPELALSCSCATVSVYFNVPIYTVLPLPAYSPHAVPDSPGIDLSGATVNGGVFEPTPPVAPVIGVPPPPIAPGPLTLIHVTVSCGEQCVGSACIDMGCEIISPWIPPLTPYPGQPPGVPQHGSVPCNNVNTCGGGICVDPTKCGNPV